MRSVIILLVCLLPALLCAAPALEIVKPIIATSDGGPPEPASFEHVPGETLFFTCRISGYSKTAEEKVHVAYSVQAFDPKGVPLTEIYKNDLLTDVTPQDKEWMPKIATEVQLPPLIATGSYKLVVKAEDVFAKTNAQLEVPFLVHGRKVEPNDTLIVRNFEFFRSEDATEPVEKAAYRAGDSVWARFDITGFKYGEHNHIDVSYVTMVYSPSGKLLWTQPEPAVDQSDSFYPKRYVQASMGINLLKDTKPGEFSIGVKVTDAVGNQTYETKQKFTVE
ncbi:MAG TPA: hypothetical protein VMH28_30170 [Candidatus Acidoferrales bacterium]|nr:hypothetical protein [Candidatus Acidoferrales bacterium]